MKFHDVIQNSEEWFALRLKKATSSKFGCFMANDGKAFGDPAKNYALQLALERITGKRAEFGFANGDTERGKEQEPIAKMLYEEEYFVTVENGGFFDCGEYGASPDGLVGKDGLIEIKSVLATTHYATVRRGSFDTAYRWQYVGHLDCTGRDWVDALSYCSDFPPGKQLIRNRIYRDQCLPELARLRARRDEFIELVHNTVKTISESN